MKVWQCRSIAVPVYNKKYAGLDLRTWKLTVSPEEFLKLNPTVVDDTIKAYTAKGGRYETSAINEGYDVELYVLAEHFKQPLDYSTVVKKEVLKKLGFHPVEKLNNLHNIRHRDSTRVSLWVRTKEDRK